MGKRMSFKKYRRRLKRRCGKQSWIRCKRSPWRRSRRYIGDLRFRRMYGEISNAYVLRPASFTADLIHSIDPVIMAAHTCGRTRNSFTASHPPNCSRPWSDSSTLNLDRRHDPAEPSTSTPGLDILYPSAVRSAPPLPLS